METFNVCNSFAHINWLSLTAAVLMAYIVGAIWYSFLFKKMWIAVNHIDVNAKVDKQNVFFTMILQLIATAFLGIVFFILTPVSVWLAVLAALAFAGWQKATTKFRISDTKTFIKAVTIDVSYFCIVAFIFILFASF